MRIINFFDFFKMLYPTDTINIIIIIKIYENIFLPCCHLATVHESSRKQGIAHFFEVTCSSDYCDYEDTFVTSTPLKNDRLVISRHMTKISDQ